eukprot:TCONS_00053761-protein
MTDTKNECPICLDHISNKCTLKCSHNFCKSCIKKIINHPFKVKCPYCRQDSKASDITLEDGENDEELFSIPHITNIIDGIYVQAHTLGLASYHFGTLSNPYISYESPECDMWPDLEDGSRPGPKKYFDQHHYDSKTRTFTGIIDWTPTKWQGEAMWKYRMIFSEDFMIVEEGEAKRYKEVNASQYMVWEFGEGKDLDYERVMPGYFNDSDTDED